MPTIFQNQLSLYSDRIPFFYHTNPVKTCSKVKRLVGGTEVEKAICDQFIRSLQVDGTDVEEEICDQLYDPLVFSIALTFCSVE